MKQQAIIVDIGGTLANCEHRRHFIDGTHGKQDWRSFYESMRTDTVNEWCKEIATKFNPIFVSGRPEEYRDITIDWLDKNGFSKTTSIITSSCDEFGYQLLESSSKPCIWPLFMRKDGDFRDDTIVKEEIYREHIEPHYNVLFAIDDRPKVCRLWRKLGIVCLQCEDKEF